MREFSIVRVAPIVNPKRTPFTNEEKTGLFVLEQHPPAEPEEGFGAYNGLLDQEGLYQRFEEFKKKYTKLAELLTEAQGIPARLKSLQDKIQTVHPFLQKMNSELRDWLKTEMDNALSKEFPHATRLDQKRFSYKQSAAKIKSQLHQILATHFTPFSATTLADLEHGILQFLDQESTQRPSQVILEQIQVAEAWQQRAAVKLELFSHFDDNHHEPYHVFIVMLDIENLFQQYTTRFVQ